MSVKEIENTLQIHTNKYIEYVPNKPTIISMREKVTDKYENAYPHAVAKDPSKRRDRAHSAMKTF